MNKKYLLSIKKNKNNVFPLLINSLNNNYIPDNYKDIDIFTSSFKDELSLKNALINLNIYSEFDLNGILIIAEFECDGNNNYKYTKKYCDKIIFEDKKNLMSNRYLYEIILDIAKDSEMCNHVYNKFINTKSLNFKNLISIFNQKNIMNNITFMKQQLIEVLKRLSYIEKRNLIIFIDEEKNKTKKYKQKILELEKSDINA